MIEKTTVLVICINKGVKSIVFAMFIKFCDESDLAILNITKKKFPWKWIALNITHKMKTQCSVAMSYLLSQRERVVGLHSNGEQPLESVGDGVGSGGSSGVANAEGEGSNVPHTLQHRENITICIQTANPFALSNSYLTCKLNNLQVPTFFLQKSF